MTFTPDFTQCLDENTLQKLASGQFPPAGLQACEEHVAACAQCRGLLESHSIDANWTEALLPAFHAVDVKEGLQPCGFAHETLLNLLGPTDDPHMLGRIGSYEVVALVGVGGMAVVFKAFDAALNRFVAIKMMQPHLALSGAARQRFEREGRAAAAVICDFVLPIYAVSEWRGIPYLVMQYSAGMNLQKRLNMDGPLQLNQTLRIAMQTARGLAAAHAQGLVHRDVKPSNIMLDGMVERAMLTDFGLARAVDDASVTRTGLITGTPLYMSPEQVLGDKVDASSDLFSLGSTIYAMCTGHPPFRGETSYAILRRIMDDQPRSIRDVNPDVPQWLERLIMKLLAKSPADRFASAEQVAELLENCLAHAQQPTVLPLPSSLLQEASRKIRKPPATRLWLAACLFVAVLAGIVIVLDSAHGTLTIECADDDVPIRVMQGDKIVKQMMLSREGKSTRIAAGEYTVEIDQPFDKAYLAEGSAVISRGGREVIRVKRTDNELRTTVCYNVAYLLDEHADAPLETQLKSLADLIRSSIKPESWNNKECSISPYAQNQSLIIQQSPATHKAIAEMLDKLKKFATLAEMWRELEKGAASTGAPDKESQQGDSEALKQVIVWQDAETGLIQIRGPSKEQVSRVAAVVEKIQSEAQGHANPTPDANPYRILFEAIARAAAAPNATPIPLKLFRDCFPAKSPDQPEATDRSESTFQLKSIGNVVRHQLAADLVAYEFDVDGLGLVQEVSAIAAGDQSVADSLLDGMLRDPQGPQIDARKLLLQAFGKRARLTCNYRQAGSLTYLVELDLIDPATFLPAFQRFFESDPRYLANAAKDFYLLSQPASGDGSQSSRWSAAVIGQKLCWGSLDMVEAARDRQGQPDKN